MAPMPKLLYLLTWAARALSQQIGKTPEIHPRFPTLKCTTESGCSKKQTSIVLDQTWRDLTDIHTGASCLLDDLSLNKTTCPTAERCAKNCALEGSNYLQTGVQVEDDAVTLHMYRRFDGELVAVGPQIYLLGSTGKDYQMLQLLNHEISFEVDISSAPCGIDAAVYLAEMDASGGRGPLNPAGAAYGTGYCDSQCYTSYAFINGVANIDRKGTCCNEMDLWEANKFATQLTAHPCNLTGIYACEGRECDGGKKGVCDNVGCGFNPYGLGSPHFYGVRSTVDTTKPFRVVTQFVTDDGTENGTLVEIRRNYIQDGHRIPNADITLKHESYDSVTQQYCGATDATSFAEHGGLDRMGEALRRGMVLVMGIWNDGTSNLNWLDSGDAGPCGKNEGSPKNIKNKHPDTSVTFADLRWGAIGSTC